MSSLNMSSHHLSSRANVANQAQLRGTSRTRVAAATRLGAPLRVECAINRKKKEEIVGKIQTTLDDSMLVFGMRFTKMPVKQMENVRRALPPETTMYVAKNSLMRIATKSDGYTQWSGIAKCTAMDNVWIFAPEEQVATTVKEIIKIAKVIAKENKASNGAGPSAEISGGVMDGHFMTEAEILKLENMPTKKDLYQKTAVAIKALPTKLARLTKAVPQKLAVAIKELSDAENPNRDAIVGDVFPKSS